MYWSLWLFILYGPLFIAAFILAVSAMSQRRILTGVALLLCTIVVPIVHVFGLGVTRTKNAFVNAANGPSEAPPLASVPHITPVVVEYDTNRFAYGTVEDFEANRGNDGKYSARGVAAIVDKNTDKAIFYLHLDFTETAGASVVVSDSPSRSGLTIYFLKLTKLDLAGINQLRSFLAKAKQWSATARAEKVSNYTKQIGILSSAMCIARDDQFSSNAGSANYAVTFRAQNPETCVVTMRGLQGGVLTEITVKEIEWDALLFVSDNLDKLLDPFLSRAQSIFARDRNSKQQEANEKNRRDAIFK